MNQELLKHLLLINGADWLISTYLLRNETTSDQVILDLIERGVDGVVTYQVAKRVVPNYTNEFWTLLIVHLSVKALLAFPMALLGSATTPSQEVHQD